MPPKTRVGLEGGGGVNPAVRFHVCFKKSRGFRVQGLKSCWLRGLIGVYRVSGFGENVVFLAAECFGA